MTLTMYVYRELTVCTILPSRTFFSIRSSAASSPVDFLMEEEKNKKGLSNQFFGWRWPATASLGLWNGWMERAVRFLLPHS